MIIMKTIKKVKSAVSFHFPLLRRKWYLFPRQILFSALKTLCRLQHRFPDIPVPSIPRSPAQCSLGTTRSPKRDTDTSDIHVSHPKCVLSLLPSWEKLSPEIRGREALKNRVLQVCHTESYCENHSEQDKPLLNKTCACSSTENWSKKQQVAFCIFKPAC